MSCLVPDESIDKDARVDVRVRKLFRDTGGTWLVKARGTARTLPEVPIHNDNDDDDDESEDDIMSFQVATRRPRREIIEEGDDDDGDSMEGSDDEDDSDPMTASRSRSAFSRLLSEAPDEDDGDDSDDSALLPPRHGQEVVRRRRLEEMREGRERRRQERRRRQQDVVLHDDQVHDARKILMQHRHQVQLASNNPMGFEAPDNERPVYRVEVHEKVVRDNQRYLRMAERDGFAGGSCLLCQYLSAKGATGFINQIALDFMQCHALWSTNMHPDMLYESLQNRWNGHLATYRRMGYDPGEIDLTATAIANHFEYCLSSTRHEAKKTARDLDILISGIRDGGMFSRAYRSGVPDSHLTVDSRLASVFLQAVQKRIDLIKYVDSREPGGGGGGNGSAGAGSSGGGASMETSVNINIGGRGGGSGSGGDVTSTANLDAGKAISINRYGEAIEEKRLAIEGRG